MATYCTLESVPQKGIWEGMRVYTLAELDGVLDVFHKYATVSTGKHPQVSVIINTGMHERNWIFANDSEYSVPVEKSPATPLKPFMDLPAVVDETGIRNMSDLTIDMAKLSPRSNYNSY
ncbi:hypothetical protein GTA08_BOTSDO13044 [Botryosphaeria dothidea]|uniref:Uncharacterized protein n=1 Tax=Botryosphaeria dothidea TaxID=55169 RepID=A0A8H4NDW0_9PEZI|nr:hypothetical protein GTA08_BOTSDO13044 [Botryosphaeria dothidea]